jgi:hypothetical protein
MEAERMKCRSSAGTAMATGKKERYTGHGETVRSDKGGLDLSERAIKSAFVIESAFAFTLHTYWTLNWIAADRDRNFSALHELCKKKDGGTRMV